MVVITEKELKKRAEHNYGRLHDLEEVMKYEYVVAVLVVDVDDDDINISILMIMIGFCWSDLPASAAHSKD